MKYVHIWIQAIILTVMLSNSGFGWAGHQESAESPIIIPFEKTDYGLIFTTLKFGDKEVRAMIDFGDQHILQVSSTLVEELGLPTEKAGYQVSDVHGNVWDVMKGVVGEVNIGDWTGESVEFTMQQGEMEAVSEQIGYEFHAVLGWGFFRDYFTEIDYAGSEMRLFAENPSTEEALFDIPFRKDAGQLIISAMHDGKEVALMIDTGSPVTVIDTRLYEQLDKGRFSFSLAEQEVVIDTYEQDLSVLSDLGVVGILGGDFLSFWTVLIDPEAATLTFSEASK